MGNEDKPRVVIACAGLGTRFSRSLAEERMTHTLKIDGHTLDELEALPKPMVPVGGIPIIEHVMRSFATQGFGDFLLRTGYGAEQIETHLSRPEFKSWKIEFSRAQPDESILEHLVRVRDRLPGPFIFSDVDRLSDTDVNMLVKAHRREGSDVTLSLAEGGSAVLCCAAVRRRVLDAAPMALTSFLKMQDGFYRVLEGLGKGIKAKNCMNINRLVDWQEANRLWADGRAFWPGAYEKSAPTKDGPARLELLEPNPQPPANAAKREALQ